MELQHEIDGAESSSQPARTRTLDSRPFQLDDEHAAYRLGQLVATLLPDAGNGEGRAANDVGQSSKVDTATGEGLRSASQALAPSLVY